MENLFDFDIRKCALKKLYLWFDNDRLCSGRIENNEVIGGF